MHYLSNRKRKNWYHHTNPVPYRTGVLRCIALSKIKHLVELVCCFMGLSCLQTYVNNLKLPALSWYPAGAQWHLWGWRLQESMEVYPSHVLHHVSQQCRWGWPRVLTLWTCVMEKEHCKDTFNCQRFNWMYGKGNCAVTALSLDGEGCQYCCCVT